MSELKIQTFTDSIAVFATPAQLNKIRTHLHALLCQFSHSLEDYGFGYVSRFDKDALEFSVQNPSGPLQEYRLAFANDYADAHVEMDGERLCSQSISGDQITQTMVGGESATQTVAFP